MGKTPRDNKSLIIQLKFLLTTNFQRHHRQEAKKKGSKVWALLMEAAILFQMRIVQDLIKCLIISNECSVMTLSKFSQVSISKKRLKFCQLSSFTD